MARTAFCLGFMAIGLFLYCLVVWVATNLAHLIPGPVGEQFRMGNETLISIMALSCPASVLRLSLVALSASGLAPNHASSSPA